MDVLAEGNLTCVSCMFLHFSKIPEPREERVGGKKSPLKMLHGSEFTNLPKNR